MASSTVGAAMLQTMGRYELKTVLASKTIEVIVAKGSVVNFVGRHASTIPTDTSPISPGTRPGNSYSNSTIGAIVNAANEGCLTGGGVDGAITAAGGPNLARDRLALPVIVPVVNSSPPPAATTTTTTTTKPSETTTAIATATSTTATNMTESDEEEGSRSSDSRSGTSSSSSSSSSSSIRCRTGDAVLTGPGAYGTLLVPYVVHAVGPNYHYYDAFAEPDALLRSAYQTSLDRCDEHGVTDVGFSLLSAGVFRGRRQAKDVLRIGIEGIRDWSSSLAIHADIIKKRKRKDNTTTEAKKEDESQDVESQDVESQDVEPPSPTSLESITLFGFSDHEVHLLLDICNADAALKQLF